MNGERKVWGKRDEGDLPWEFHNLGTAGLCAALHRFLEAGPLALPPSTADVPVPLEI